MPNNLTIRSCSSCPLIDRSSYLCRHPSTPNVHRAWTGDNIPALTECFMSVYNDKGPPKWCPLNIEPFTITLKR